MVGRFGGFWVGSILLWGCPSRDIGNTVVVDGRSCLNWSNFRQLSPDENWWGKMNPRAPWIASWQCSFAIDEIKLIPVSSQGRRLR